MQLSEIDTTTVASLKSDVANMNAYIYMSSHNLNNRFVVCQYRNLWNGGVFYN